MYSTIQNEVMKVHEPPKLATLSAMRRRTVSSSQSRRWDCGWRDPHQVLRSVELGRARSALSIAGSAASLQQHPIIVPVDLDADVSSRE